LDSPEQLIAKVEQTLREMKSYSCELRMTMVVEAQGMENQMVSQYSVKVEKPNRWALVMNSGMMGGTSVSDGKNLTSYSPMTKQYAVEELPEDWLERASDAGLAQNFMMMGVAGFPQFFMGRQLQEWLLNGVTNSEYAGTEPIDGVACHTAKFDQEDSLHWQIWAEAGPKTLIRRLLMVPDFSEQAEQMGANFKDMKLEIQFEFSNWKSGEKFPAEAFVYQPPKDAEKVASLFGGAGAHEAPHPLLGEAAPTFELKDVSGEVFKLDDHLGQHVVVLDFWATWCPPCVKALPEVTRVASEFADRGVVFFAVNQGEEADKINEFLREKQLDTPVLLDGDSTVGELYQANAIPQTVLIGKDGRVQVVHVGFAGNFGKQLTEELEALLENKDLATEALEEHAEAVEELGDEPQEEPHSESLDP